MTELTKQSEAILSKLTDKINSRTLSDDELGRIRKALSLLESIGVLSNMLIKAAGIVAAGAALIQYWPESKK